MAPTLSSSEALSGEEGSRGYRSDREKDEFDQTEHNQRYFPNMVHNLRACLGCRMIMTKEQFFAMGCPTCVDLQMKENENRVVACTTTAFQGFIANIRPGAFVSRFNGLENNRPGVYALSVLGKIPDQITTEAQEERNMASDRERSPELARLRQEKERLLPGLTVPSPAAHTPDEASASAADEEAPEGGAPARKRLKRQDEEAGVAAPALDPSESDGEFRKAEASAVAPAMEPSESDGEFRKASAGNLPSDQGTPAVEPSESDGEFKKKADPVLVPKVEAGSGGAAGSDGSSGLGAAAPPPKDGDEADEFVFKD